MWYHGQVMHRHMIERTFARCTAVTTSNSVSAPVNIVVDDDTLHEATLAAEDASLLETPVVEEVEHAEPPADIAPEEAAEVSSQQWASAIERLNMWVPSASSPQWTGTDGIGATSSGSRVVLLEFGRSPKEMYEALLGSELAARLRSDGVDLQPDWAAGGLVLAAGLEEGSTSEVTSPWHVAVRESDEEAVYTALRSLGHDVRPRLKAGSRGRAFIPEEESLMDVSEGGNTGESKDESDNEEDEGDSHGEICASQIPVFRTFLHTPVERLATVSTRSAQIALP